MNRKKKEIGLHIIGSLLFLSVPFLNTPGVSDKSYVSFRPEEQKELIQFLLLLSFFYLNYFVLIPWLAFGKNSIVYIAVIVASMFLIATIPSLLIDAAMPSIPGPPPREVGNLPMPRGNGFFRRINHNVFLFLAVVCFSLVLRLRDRWQETERKKADAELLYLKTQINPHFLYNTLNSIYALALQKADNTAEAVQMLSSLMRYTLTESANKKVPLSKEMEYIENYIHLQRFRFGSEMTLRFHVQGDGEGKVIAPLLLISFIENAFKYGVNAEEANEIIIDIEMSENKLVLFVSNKIVRAGGDEGGGTKLGLANTIERLKLLYPSSHSLQMVEGNNYYSVTLSILL